MEFPTVVLLPNSASSPAAADVHAIHFHNPLPFFLIHRSLRRSPVLNVSPLVSRQLARTMADAESTITDSSLAPSTTPTSLLDPGTHSVHMAERPDKCERRASLGLMDAARVRFSKDVSDWVLNTPPARPIYTVRVVPNTC